MRLVALNSILIGQMNYPVICNVASNRMPLSLSSVISVLLPVVEFHIHFNFSAVSGMVDFIKRSHAALY